MDYIQIIKKSWQIVKKNKPMWVYGLVLAAFTAGSSMSSGYNGGSSGNFNLDKFFKNKDKIPKDAPEKISQVLGQAVTDPLKFITGLLSPIPATFWLTLGIGLFLIIIFGIILRIFLINWSKGALFALAKDALEGKETTLKKGSDYGRKYWTRLWLLNLILWGAYSLIVIFSIIIFAGLIVLMPIAIKIFFGIILVFEIIALFPVSIFIILWSTFSSIVVCTENYSLQKALSFGKILAKKFLLDSLLMGVFNVGINCIAGCIIPIVFLIALGVFGGITAGTFILGGIFGIFPLTISILVFILLIAGFLVVSGVLKALTMTNWIIFYNEIKKNQNFPNNVISNQ